MLLTASLMSLWLASAVVEDPGHKLFLEYKCNLCHSIEVLEIEAKQEDEEKRGPDLSTLAEGHDAAWVQKFLLKETDVEGRKHKKKFTGEQAELITISEWLEGLAEKKSTTTEP